MRSRFPTSKSTEDPVHLPDQASNGHIGATCARPEAQRSAIDRGHYAASIIDVLPCPALVLDAALEVKSANPSFCQYFNIANSQIESKQLFDFKNLSWSPAMRDLLSSLKPGERFSRNIDAHKSVPESTYRSIVVNVKKLSDEGANSRLVMAFEDISEQRRANENLRTEFAAVERQATELRRSNEDLAKFAQVASHDLRAPLATVHQYVQMLQRKLGGTLDEDNALYFEYIIQATERMTGLIEGLLAYAQVSNLDSEMPEVTDVEAILNKAIDNLRAPMVESLATLDHGHLPAVCVHPTQLLQLLQNLIANAIQYRGSSPPQVHISATESEKEWIFAVRDNGIGISSEHCNRVFEPFKRLHGQERPGTGLGLAICKHIVEHWGGTLWVESNVNQGSAFFFTVPV